MQNYSTLKIFIGLVTNILQILSFWWNSSIVSAFFIRPKYLELFLKKTDTQHIGIPSVSCGHKLQLEIHFSTGLQLDICAGVIQLHCYSVMQFMCWYFTFKCEGGKMHKWLIGRVTNLGQTLWEEATVNWPVNKTYVLWEEAIQ